MARALRLALGLNLALVTAPFGTDLFNQQLAYLSAFTRVALR